MNKHSLLIDDDPRLFDLLKPQISSLGYDLVYQSSGDQGLKAALGQDFEFILLDMQLPGLGGSEICRRIRDKKNTPILMLTSNTEELNKVLLLELGADDYITKPFSIAELQARIKAVLRRVHPRENADNQKLSFGKIEIDLEARTLSKNGKTVELTARQFDLISLMATNPGKVFTRDELNYDYYGGIVSGYERSITNHISRIRKKLEDDPDNPDYLKTIHGVGYSFVVPE